SWAREGESRDGRFSSEGVLGLGFDLGGRGGQDRRALEQGTLAALVVVLGHFLNLLGGLAVPDDGARGHARAPVTHRGGTGRCTVRATSGLCAAGVAGVAAITGGGAAILVLAEPAEETVLLGLAAGLLATVVTPTAGAAARGVGGTATGGAAGGAAGGA